MTLKKENADKNADQYRKVFYPKIFFWRIRRKIGGLNLKAKWFARRRGNIDPLTPSARKFLQPNDTYRSSVRCTLRVNRLPPVNVYNLPEQAAAEKYFQYESGSNIRNLVDQRTGKHFLR